MAAELNSADQGMQVDADSQDPSGRRHAAFNPIRSLKRFFGGRSGRRNLEGDKLGIGSSGQKAKSTTDMLHEGQKVDVAETRFSPPLPRKQLSMSADSVFSLERLKDVHIAPVIPPSLTRSNESISERTASAGVDLAQVPLNRCRDEDEGHPHSPLTLATTADVITDNPGKLDKWPSFDSGHSLLSVDSSENELDEDFFKDKWQGSAAVGPTRGKTGDIPHDIDLSQVRRHASLSSCAAVHKLAVRPKNKRISSAYFQKMKATQKPIEVVEILTLVDEENIPNIIGDASKVEEFSTAHTLAAEAARRVSRKAEAKEFATDSSATDFNSKKDSVIRRLPKMPLVSNEEKSFRRQTVAISGDNSSLHGGTELTASKRFSTHLSENDKTLEPETVSEFTQVFAKFKRRTSQNLESDKSDNSKPAEPVPNVDKFPSSVKTEDKVTVFDSHRCTMTDIKPESGLNLTASKVDVTPKAEPKMGKISVTGRRNTVDVVTTTEKNTTTVLLETNPAKDASKPVDAVQHPSTQAERLAPAPSVVRMHSRVYGAKPSPIANITVTTQHSPAVKEAAVSSSNTCSTQMNTGSSVVKELKSAAGCSSLDTGKHASTTPTSSSVAVVIVGQTSILATSEQKDMTKLAHGKLGGGLASTAQVAHDKTNNSQVAPSLKSTSSETKSSSDAGSKLTASEKKPPLPDVSSPAVWSLGKEKSPSSTAALSSSVKKSYSISYKASMHEDQQPKSRSMSQSEPLEVDALAMQRQTSDAGTGILLRRSSLSSDKSDNTQTNQRSSVSKNGGQPMGHIEEREPSYVQPLVSHTASSNIGKVIFSSTARIDSLSVVSPQSSKNLPVAMLKGTGSSRTAAMSKSLDSAEIKKSVIIAPAKSSANVSGDDRPLIELSSTSIGKSTKAASSSSTEGKVKLMDKISGDCNVDNEPAWFALARRKTKDWNDERL